MVMVLKNKDMNMKMQQQHQQELDMILKYHMVYLIRQILAILEVNLEHHMVHFFFTTNIGIGMSDIIVERDERKAGIDNNYCVFGLLFMGYLFQQNLLLVYQVLLNE